MMAPIVVKDEDVFKDLVQQTFKKDNVTNQLRKEVV